MSPGTHSSGESLNPYQANRLRITCQYIDKLLAEIESALNTTIAKDAFPRYIADVLPTQQRTIEDYIARVRAQLIRVLEGQGIPREKPSVPVSRAVRVKLGAIDIAVEELKPKYMRGYGDVPESVSTELNGIVGELSGLVQRFDQYLSEGVGEDLTARLRRLESPGNDLDLLRRIEETVRERGLVEFRSAISDILDRAEDKSFEIAVFGRVSSGKSSLLNAVLGTDVLPIGVTPITAVPTRIVYAAEPSLGVWFSEAPPRKFEASQLRQFATEQGNPGNAKHVTRLVVALPASRLRNGVSFMDTPGLGSLARNGANETLAYLPKCDFGVVLIDAGSTLTAEDLRTILALQEAAIPVTVLLSKSDLVALENRASILRYISDHIRSECKLSIPVYPVSVLPSCQEMLTDWFENQITPLCARSRELRALSLRRKIGRLRDSVVHSVESRIQRSSQASIQLKERAQAAEVLLRKSTGRIEETRLVCSRLAQSAAIEALKANATELSAEAGKRLLHAWANSSYGVVVPGQLVRDSITQSIQLQVRMLQNRIASLAQQLDSDLRQCAAELEIPDIPSEGEFQALVRDTPLFEIPSFTMEISHPWVPRMLGERIMMRWVASKISRQMRPDFHRALENYWQLVGIWVNSVIVRMNQKFDTYAESYRAHAEQILGGRELTADEVARIQESLTQLRPSLATADSHVAGTVRGIPTPQEEKV